MRVVFHIISTGGGGGASRATRYIAERDKDPTREGPGARPLFSEDRNGLTYRNADRILDPLDGQPQKDDLIHLSVSFQEEDFEKLGRDEKERQAGLRQVIREGMKGMAQELNVEDLTWVAGIHRNTDNPHAHIVILNEEFEHGAMEERQFSRLRTSLLPHKQMVDGKEVVVPGRIGERLLTALERQQERFLSPDQYLNKAQEEFDRTVERTQKVRLNSEPPERSVPGPRDDKLTRQFKARRGAQSHPADQRTIVQSWNEHSNPRANPYSDYRIALGRYLELSTRLAFAEVWRERAVKYGETYRFEVIDQSLGEDRKLSELDVHRRAAARAQRTQPIDRAGREREFEADLSRHRETLDQLLEAQEAKIAALGKDVGALRGTVSKVQQGLNRRYDAPSDTRSSPIMSRETLSSLQSTAIRLNLPDQASELEQLRLSLAREFKAPVRTDDEAAILTAQVNVARADLQARNARIENFEASVQLNPYEVHGERWSLGALDKQIKRRSQDAKFVPERAQRLDLRSLTRLNYSPSERDEARRDIEHLTFIRGEIVRQIQQRREPLVNDRDRTRDVLDVLEDAYDRETTERQREGQELPEAQYASHQIRSLEASAEILRDPKLLQEVHELEKHASRVDPESDWQGRVVAREIMAGIALDEANQRLQHFLESKRVASLSLGDHRTGTLRDVEARTATEYVARLIESRPMREHRNEINVAAKDHHAHLVSDFQKSRDYYNAARVLSSEAQGQEPRFTDKEKINLEIYAERQEDEMTRQNYLALARGDDQSQERAAVVSHSR